MKKPKRDVRPLEISIYFHTPWSDFLQILFFFFFLSVRKYCIIKIVKIVCAFGNFVLSYTIAAGVFFIFLFLFFYCSHVQRSNQCREVCGGGGRDEKTISSGFKLFTNAYCTGKNSFSVRINYKHSLRL